MRKILSLACGLAAIALAGYCTAGDAPPPANPPSAQLATAIFAGGCFWCVEADFEKLAGVVDAESGYAGGHLANPTYEQVSHGGTGHAEAVRVRYDPSKVTYEQLLDYFWHHIDPTVKDRQFCDVGDQYRTAIFYRDETQKKAAEASKAALERSGRFAHIYTAIAPAGAFYPAEDYHQDYYKKNPIRYNYYRKGCGRDARVKEVWEAAHF
ncbi:MAG TPA: peptide-methionine (S)-S-oxide reductase MsrA [Novimethylophilus sp.]|jgi:peptide-methionine (S)-S-oxide reductase|uniref:peptide-methionine (S)-S-oxide reductase MsrA n=1 Tax=Novimethylophilus sp. TaxID=2137426 RepID=UPI002F3FBA1D